MKPLIRRFCLSSLVALATLTTAWGQERKITRTSLAFDGADFVVTVSFDAPLSPEFASAIRDNFRDFAPANITIVSLPSKTILSVKAASLDQGLDPPGQAPLPSSANMTLNLGPQEGDDKFQICFEKLHFFAPNAAPIEASNVCGSGSILNEALAKARLEQLLADLNKVPKSTGEKNIFASGFVTRGTNADSQGGSVLNLNSNDLGVPGLTAFTHLKKTTAMNADPKHFDVGLNYRSTLLFHRKALAEIRDLQAVGKNEEAQAKLDELRKAWWSSATFDFATKFEAQALSFDVTNFIGDGTVRLKSRVLPLRGRNDNSAKNRAGFFKFFIVPGGLEIGQVLQKGEQTAAMMGTTQTQAMDKIDWVARYKFGGGLSLFYRNPESRWLFKRIELDTEFVGRQLFRQEIKFDEKTMMNIKTTKGFKPWFETWLRAYVADTPNGRFGIGLTYNRGSLPPVFAKTDSFQFGFVFETAEDKK
jgi:hypothetical protein